MQPPAIPVRSQRQAMDWSLVLISQGIQAVIDPPTDEHGWQLRLAPDDYPLALRALTTYQRENRQRRWHQALPGTDLVFDWRSLAWAFLIVLIFAVAQSNSDRFTEQGLMNNQAVRAGEWWRPITAVTLHADWTHLVSNVTTGTVLLGFAMGAFGAGYGLLASFLAGVAANAMALLLYPEHRALGASGMVMGSLGVLTAQSLAFLRHGVEVRPLLTRAVLAGVLLLILFGFDPRTDVTAHVAGFGFGVVFGAGLALLPSGVMKSELGNRLAELGTAVILAGAWAWALR